MLLRLVHLDRVEGELLRLSADRGRQSPSENPFPAATWISFSLALSASSTGSSDASNDPVPSSPQ